MARRLRFIPEGGSLVEVTCRTLQGRFLLRPSEQLRSTVVGIMARGQRLFPVRIHAYVFLSNHYHLLMSVEDAFQMAGFINYLNSNLAREVGRLHGWREKIWGRRYQAIVVSEEEAAQIGRLRYVLSHGCKEGLVARPRDWPGAQCVMALTSSETIRGHWYDRTREYSARMRGKPGGKSQYSTREVIQLDPMPCWADRSDSERRDLVNEIVKEIEVETAARHGRDQTAPVGRTRVLRQHPHQRPDRSKKGCAPAWHVATRRTRRELVRAYRCFESAFRQAAARLRAGETRPRFPLGSFPPRLPFVDWSAELKPG